MKPGSLDGNVMHTLNIDMGRKLLRVDSRIKGGPGGQILSKSRKTKGALNRPQSILVAIHLHSFTSTVHCELEGHADMSISKEQSRNNSQTYLQISRQDRGRDSQ